jgi:hypothetical protein
MCKLERYVGFLFLIAVLVPAEVAAATYYVSKNGNDGYTCSQAQSESTPRRTVNAGVSCLSAGDQLLVKAGTYAEGLINNIPPGTSWTNKVRVANYASDVVWLAPASGNRVIEFSGTQQYIEIDGINLDGTKGIGYDVVKINNSATHNAHHIRIKNLEIVIAKTGYPNLRQGIMAQAQDSSPVGNNEFINLRIHGGNSHGIYLLSPNNLVEFCEFYDITKNGIQVYNTNYPANPSGNVIRYNVLHDFYRSPEAGDDNDVQRGMVLYGTRGQAYGNLIYNITRTSPLSEGIAVRSGTWELYNNTIYNASGSGIHLGPGSGNSLVRNNISYGNGSSNYWNEGSGTTASSNLFGPNPSFEDPSKDNFRLRSDSAAVDSGDTIALVTTDVDGTSRPQNSRHDIGAYERSTGSSVPLAPSGLTILSN